PAGTRPRHLSSAGDRVGTMQRGETMIDFLYRSAYRTAYRMMRLYWSMAHPATHGALLAIWNEGEILLVRNSYVPYYSLPGGYVHRDETGRQAAARELFEET